MIQPYNHREEIKCIKKLLTYLITTFSITYIAWWGLALLTQLHILDSSDGLFTLIHVIGGFGSTIAAILLLPDRTSKGILKFVFSCKKSSFWYLLLFCAMQGAVIGFSSMLRLHHATPSKFFIATANNRNGKHNDRCCKPRHLRINQLEKEIPVSNCDTDYRLRLDVVAYSSLVCGQHILTGYPFRPILHLWSDFKFLACNNL